MRKGIAGALSFCVPAGGLPGALSFWWIMEKIGYSCTKVRCCLGVLVHAPNTSRWLGAQISSIASSAIYADTFIIHFFGSRCRYLVKCNCSELQMGMFGLTIVRRNCCVRYRIEDTRLKLTRRPRTTFFCTGLNEIAGKKKRKRLNVLWAILNERRK